VGPFPLGPSRPAVPDNDEAQGAVDVTQFILRSCCYMVKLNLALQVSAPRYFRYCEQWQTPLWRSLTTAGLITIVFYVLIYRSVLR